jgi:hypothetical protein
MTGATNAPVPGFRYRERSYPNKKMNRSDRFGNKYPIVGVFDLYLLFLLFSHVEFDPLDCNDWSDCFNYA